MANVVIRNRTRQTRNITLRREYEGVADRALYIRPDEMVVAPAEIVAEAELMQEAKKGYVTVTGDASEPKRDTKKDAGKRSPRKKRKED